MSSADLDDWRNYAAFAETDPELFYPEGKGSGRSTAKAAKAICGDCEVKADCLETAVRDEERYGIWGGTTWEERRPMITARHNGKVVDLEIDDYDTWDDAGRVAEVEDGREYAA